MPGLTKPPSEGGTAKKGKTIGEFTAGKKITLWKQFLGQCYVPHFRNNSLEEGGKFSVKDTVTKESFFGYMKHMRDNPISTRGDNRKPQYIGFIASSFITLWQVTASDLLSDE